MQDNIPSAWSSTKRLVQMALLAARDLLDPLFSFEEVAVLCYHSISDAKTPNTLVPEVFSSQLEYLKRKGYSFVSADDILAWMNGNKNLRKAIAITFDDGYADFETVALPILEKFNVPVTLFVVGNGAASRAALSNGIPLLTPEALEKVRNHPLVTLGYHSMTHLNFSRLPKDVLLEESRSTYNIFAYPGGNYSSEATEVLKELGYRAAFTIKRHLVKKGSDQYLLPRSVITRDMSHSTVRFHASRALEWYRAL